MGENEGEIDWGKNLPRIRPLKPEKVQSVIESLEKLLTILYNGMQKDKEHIQAVKAGESNIPTNFISGLASNNEVKILIAQIAEEFGMEKFGLFSKANLEEFVKRVQKQTIEYRDCSSEVLSVLDNMRDSPLANENLTKTQDLMYTINSKIINIVQTLSSLEVYIKAILDRIDDCINEQNTKEVSSDRFFEFLEKHPECVNPKSITEFLAAKLQEEKEKINHPENTSLNKYKKSWTETLHILREKSSGNKIFFVGLEDFIKNHLQNFSEELGASIKDEIQQFAAEIDDRVRVEGMLNPKSQK